jgi:hypothetical protein
VGRTLEADGYRVLVGNLGNKSFIRPRYGWENDIEWILLEWVLIIWIGLNRFRNEYSCRLCGVQPSCCCFRKSSKYFVSEIALTGKHSCFMFGRFFTQFLDLNQLSSACLPFNTI